MESTDRERGREFASEPRHRGGSKVCALHHNGHPVTNTDEPGRVMLHSRTPISWVNKPSLPGNQRTSSPVLLDGTVVCVACGTQAEVSRDLKKTKTIPKITQHERKQRQRWVDGNCCCSVRCYVTNLGFASSSGSPKSACYRATFSFAVGFEARVREYVCPLCCCRQHRPAAARWLGGRGTTAQNQHKLWSRFSIPFLPTPPAVMTADTKH